MITFGSMNKLYHLLFVIFGGLCLSCNSIQKPSAARKVQSAKEANTVYPQEYFYLDKNYPATVTSEKTYQQKMRSLMAFDKAQIHQHRGLDFPWKVQGPGNIGGRVNSIAVHPADLDIVMLGFSQGGVYRTEDAGQTWAAVFDDQTSLAISHISFDPQNPDVAFATTGDVNISGYPFTGSGVYRSDDAGLTWTHKGLDNTGVLSKVFVDPYNSEIVYAGSMGYPSHKGDVRGVFKSDDGGESWYQTLFIDDSTGVIDMAVDPSTPGRVYASSWTRLRTSTYGTTMGPGTSLYRSDDHGETWMQIKNGLPGEHHSRTGVEVTNDGTLFMSYTGTVTDGECAGETEALKGLYRSYDAGNQWEQIPVSEFNGVPCGMQGGFGWYFETLKVNPENPRDMYLLGVDLFRSVDGGDFWFDFVPPWWTYEVHADKHDLAFAGDYMYLGTDGGAYYGWQNGGVDTWIDIENIPSTQFYRTAFNPHKPDQYFGGAQDNGTTGGNASMINEWPRLLGGDGFQPLFDPDEPDWMYGLIQNGSVNVSRNGGQDWESLTDGLFNSAYWDMPLVMSPHDPKILFCGTDRVFKISMLDFFPEWTPISDDLTRQQTILGDRYPAITAIAQSAIDPLRLYAGTQDGKLWTTGDGGITWQDITEGTPGFYVTSITPSTKSDSGVFVTYSGYRDNDHTPYIFKSEDAGQSWNGISTNLPLVGVNNLLLLPGWNDGVIIVATDGGVYGSTDGGSVWERIGTNFPYMPVYDIDYNPVENTLVAATFSRGIMTFPVEELDIVSSMEEKPNDLHGVRVYPTVFNDRLHLDVGKNLLNNGMRIEISDQRGSIVWIENVASFSGKHTLQLPDLPVGLYFVSISDGKSGHVTRTCMKGAG